MAAKMPASPAEKGAANLSWTGGVSGVARYTVLDAAPAVAPLGALDAAGGWALAGAAAAGAEAAAGAGAEPAGLALEPLGAVVAPPPQAARITAARTDPRSASLLIIQPPVQQAGGC